MNNKITKLVALALILIVTLSGCNLIRVDPEYTAKQEALKAAEEQAAFEADMATVVATYEGGTITNGDIINEFTAQNNNAYYMKYLMYSWGLSQSMDMTKEEYETLQRDTIQNIAKEKILYAKAAQMGVSTEFTDEDMPELQIEADKIYQSALNNFAMMGYSESMVQSVGYTPEDCIRLAKISKIEQRMLDIVNVDTSVSDEEARAEYDAQLAEQISASDTDPSALEADVLGGAVALFYPENYRYVKHILLMPSDTTLTTQLRTLSSEINTLNTEIKALDEQLSALDGESAPDESTPDEAEPTAEELTAQRDEKAKQAQDKQTQHDDIQAAIWADIQPTLDEVNAKIQAGEPIDALIEEYTQDPGSRNEPIKTTGYLIYANSSMWDPVFLEAAIAIQNVGEYAQPVLGASGVHIIKYEAEALAGQVAFEDVRERLLDKLLNEKRNEIYTQARDLWIEEANLTIDLNGWRL